MLVWPTFAKELAREAIEKHSQCDDAIKAFRARLKRHAEYPSLADTLFDVATAELIHELRHRTNRANKRATNQYGGPAKVLIGESKTIASMYDRFYIGGQCLGNILGERIGDLLAQEESQAYGHSLNAALLRKLKPLVPADKTVRQAVPEKKLQQIWRECNRALTREGDEVRATDGVLVRVNGRANGAKGERGTEIEAAGAHRSNGHANGKPTSQVKPINTLAKAK